MKKEIETIRNEVEEAKESQVNAYELAIRTIEQNYKREKFMVKLMFVIILILLAIDGFLAYQFATTTVVETTETTTDQTGAYNFVDSEGNMISSDLSLEEMQELIDLNGGNE